MVLAHGPHPTIAFASDMAAPARPRQGVIYHAHMFSHSEHGPGTRALVLGPYPLLVNICALSTRPGQGCHIEYECNGGIRAKSKYRPSQGPYRIRMQWWHDLSSRMVCEQGYDPNWIWIWIYPVWDSMTYPVLRTGLQIYQILARY